MDTVISLQQEVCCRRNLSKKLVQQPIIIEEVILINNLANLKQLKTNFQLMTNWAAFSKKPKTIFFSKQKTTATTKKLFKAILCWCNFIQEISHCKKTCPASIPYKTKRGSFRVHFGNFFALKSWKQQFCQIIFHPIFCLYATETSRKKLYEVHGIDLP